MSTTISRIGSVDNGVVLALICSVTVSVPVSQLRIAWTSSSNATLTITDQFNTTALGSQLLLELRAETQSTWESLYTCIATAEENGVTLTSNATHTIIAESKFTGSQLNFYPSIATDTQMTVTVVDSPPGKHIEGANMTLTCSVNIPHTTVWSSLVEWSSANAGLITINDTKFTVTPTTNEGDGLIKTTLVINTLTVADDNDTQYLCRMTLFSSNATNSLTLITTSTGSFTGVVKGMYTLSQKGIDIICPAALVTPQIIFNTNCQPLIGEDYLLSCAASVDQQVSNGLNLMLINEHNGSVVASGAHTVTTPVPSSFEDVRGVSLLLHSLNTVVNYTCIASLSFPKIHRSTTTMLSYQLVPIELSKST